MLKIVLNIKYDLVATTRPQSFRWAFPILGPEGQNSYNQTNVSKPTSWSVILLSGVHHQGHRDLWMKRSLFIVLSSKFLSKVLLFYSQQSLRRAHKEQFISLTRVPQGRGWGEVWQGWGGGEVFF